MATELLIDTGLLLHPPGSYLNTTLIVQFTRLIRKINGRGNKLVECVEAAALVCNFLRKLCFTLTHTASRVVSETDSFSLDMNHCANKVLVTSLAVDVGPAETDEKVEYIPVSSSNTLHSTIASRTALPHSGSQNTLNALSMAG